MKYPGATGDHLAASLGHLRHVCYPMAETESSGGATTRASQGGRPMSLQVRFGVYLLTVKVAENEKDGSEKT